MNIKTEHINIPLNEIGESYGGLRIVNPAADISIYDSMKKYGQISPVIVCRLREGRYELIDGFKRLRAARRLDEIKSLYAMFMDVGIHAGKAAILQLNWVGKSISDMEEAMVVHSLYREDLLTQAEIGTLLCRHKSWICRRISLVERLCDEVCDNIRLGLIQTSIGRELTRLPRGNQTEVMSTIQKHRLTYRETEKLVSALLTCPAHEHKTIIMHPYDILQNRIPKPAATNDNRLSQAGSLLNRKLVSMERSCLSVVEGISVNSLSHLIESDIVCLSPLMGRAIRAAELVIDTLKKVLSTHTKTTRDSKELVSNHFTKEQNNAGIYPQS